MIEVIQNQFIQSLYLQTLNNPVDPTQTLNSAVSDKIGFILDSISRLTDKLPLFILIAAFAIFFIIKIKHIFDKIVSGIVALGLILSSCLILSLTSTNINSVTVNDEIQKHISSKVVDHKETNIYPNSSNIILKYSSDSYYVDMNVHWYLKKNNSITELTYDTYNIEYVDENGVAVDVNISEFDDDVQKSLKDTNSIVKATISKTKTQQSFNASNLTQFNTLWNKTKHSLKNQHVFTTETILTVTVKLPSSVIEKYKQNATDSNDLYDFKNKIENDLD